MQKYLLDLRVKSVEHINEKYVLMRLTDDMPLPEMQPGQFVEIKVDNSPATFLRRPISIHNVDRENNELWLLIAAIGEGTKHLAQMTPGEALNVLLPLGNNFTLGNKKTLLVGGGVGVAPLLYAGKVIKENGGEPVFLLGARKAADLLELDRFSEVGR
ncbi:MAG: dihydroorotate dehydrogenase electron transfer subunit, partial [Prevotella sp.]|nr:dihydroorotate dehydrogenase electron transfer subunit [Prevotella sp.]